MEVPRKRRLGRACIRSARRTVSGAAVLWLALLPSPAPAQERVVTEWPRVAGPFVPDVRATPPAADMPLLPVAPLPRLVIATDEPAAGGTERRLVPPGLLRYAVPDGARPFAIPYAVVGAGLLAADEPVLRVLKLDSLYLRQDGTAAHQAHLVFRTFSRLGDPPVVAAALAGLYALGGTRERNAARVGGVAYANTLALTMTLKTLTGKERPYRSGGRLRYHGPNLRNQSWPSGHASGTSTVAHVLAHYYPDGRVLWYGLSGMTGVSRIGLARHWPSDVWWGWGAGVLGAEGALREHERIERWRPW